MLDSVAVSLSEALLPQSLPTQRPRRLSCPAPRQPVPRLPIAREQPIPLLPMPRRQLLQLPPMPQRQLLQLLPTITTTITTTTTTREPVPLLQKAGRQPVLLLQIA